MNERGGIYILCNRHAVHGPVHDLFGRLRAGHRAGAGTASWQVKELYVKWRGRAYTHCAWVPEAAVLAAARRAAGQQLLRRLKAFRQHQEDSVRPPTSRARLGTGMCGIPETSRKGNRCCSGAMHYGSMSQLTLHSKIQL